MLSTHPPGFRVYREVPASTSPPTAVEELKTSKKKKGGHVRRQNRSCDQCRKGKRRCDAAVLRDRGDGTQYEDEEWEYDGSQRTPAPCTYCVKTKKQCTFEWLKSQESQLKGKKDVSQDPSMKPNKRVKAEDSSRQHGQSESDSSTSPDMFDHTHYPNGSSTSLNGEKLQEYPFIDPALQQYPFASNPFEFPGELSLPGYNYNDVTFPQVPFDVSHGPAPTSQQSSPEIGKAWDQSDFSDINYLVPRAKRQLIVYDEYANEDASSNGSSFKIPVGLVDTSPLSLADRLSRSVNHTMVSESLMQIYHDSMENALSCWLAERTCPYLSKTKMIKASPRSPTTEKFDHISGDENWPNRMFKRVYRLDRVAGKIRTRPLSHYEEKAASKALYLVIMAFATQWSQGSRRAREEHPLPSGIGADRNERSHSTTSFTSSSTDDYDFDRQMQESYWYQARNALLQCAETESFKVAFANIIFSFTQKPLSTEQRAEIRQATAMSPVFTSQVYDMKCVEEEVERVLSEDGPPMYFEQGIRNAHLLRDRLLRLERELEGTEEKLLSEEDRTTVDLIAWLGYMGDTLVSTILQRPLVVADEDCDVLPEAVEALKLSDTDTTTQRPGASRLWSDYMFMQERFNRGGEMVRYPCSYDQAAAGLTDAAPIKVLLYRKVQAIQNLMSRHALATKIEEAIQDAKGVYHHWKMVYEPFVQDLIEHHDTLHPRLQAWYICLTAHYYLAALLFTDAMYQVDSACLGLSSHRLHRQSGNVIPSLRRHNSLMIASVAHRATPHENASFPHSDFHHAMNSGALLTEPWTALLIRAFFKATVLLLQDASSPSSQGEVRTKLIRGAKECVRAIKYLGRKSDTAVLAGEMLTAAIDNQVNQKTEFMQKTEFLHPQFDTVQLDNVQLDNLGMFNDLCDETTGPRFELLI